MEEMKEVKDFPPNIEEIKEFFDLDGLDVVFAYGDTIYNPTDNEISDHLMVHESTHQKQQGDDPAGWWTKYLEDPEFRLEQEVEAYANQYSFVKGKYGAKRGKWFLNEISAQLSSKMYGNIIEHHKAETRIRLFSKNLIK